MCVEYKSQGVMRAMLNSDSNEEELGIRAFQIKKAKAVERAVQLIRHDLGAQWTELTGEEIEELEWVLGELWGYVARHDWDELRFGRLSLRDIIRILTFGSQMRRHARNSIEILKDVYAVILAASARSAQLAEE